MGITGFTLLFCNFIYFKLLPARPLLIRLEQSVLMFNFGWSFWLVMVAGVLCVLMGGAVSIIDLIYPHKFSTILEVDFGTPFDRHTIIEDSQETKKKKKNLPADRAIERADSSQSFSSQCRKDSNDQGKKDEVCIVVSNRKDSITSAVRRNSGGETTRPENIW